jgi:hypothetical protein
LLIDPNHFVLWIFSVYTVNCGLQIDVSQGSDIKDFFFLLFFKAEIQIKPEELEEGGGKLRTSHVSNEFCCPISTILDSDIPVAALQGSRTFGYALMEPMPDSKALKDTNWL